MQPATAKAFNQSAVYRYGLGFAITLGFLLTARALYFLISYNPVILVMTAIIAVAWICGRGPGIASALIAAFGIRPLFFPNAPYRFDFGDLLRLLFYLILTAFVSYLVGARRKAEGELRAANAELDRRVQERTAELLAANEDLRHSNEALSRERTRVEAANQALRRANEDLEQFAYSASHDLQEPIRNVAIYSQIVGRRYGDVLDDQGREFLSHITGGAHRMEMLVRDLLAYTQAASDHGAPVAAADANLVFNNTLSNFSEAMRETEATVLSDPLPQLWVHEVHLQQLFQNLIGNALKYRSEKSPRIQVSAEDIEGYWRFSVQDNGIGINPEYKEKIFGIFKRLHHNGKYPGTGIGLAICQRVVERYGGRIWVESAPGEGSTFFFTVRNGGPSSPS